jgi:L-asparaginase
MTGSSTPPRVLVIGLGGTIAMGRGDGEGLRAALAAPEIVDLVPDAASIALIETFDFKAVASAEIGVADAVVLGGIIEAAVSRGVDGVVVMHGTDTLEDTAFALDILLELTAPVVVTGAMRGSDALSADGPANLAAALRVAASPRARDLGVLVVMNDQVHAARYAQKRHTGNAAAFSSPGAGPLGILSEGKLRLMLRPASPSPSVRAGAHLPLVCILPVVGGAGSEMIEAVASLNPAGVVVAALGAGHVPSAWSEPLGRLAQDRVVVLSSLIGVGPVFTGGYGYAGGEIDLLRRGLIPAGDLTPGKARVLLSLLLGAGADRDAVVAAFAAF